MYNILFVPFMPFSDLHPSCCLLAQILAHFFAELKETVSHDSQALRVYLSLDQHEEKPQLTGEWTQIMQNWARWGTLECAAWPPEGYLEEGKLRQDGFTLCS